MNVRNRFRGSGNTKLKSLKGTIIISWSGQGKASASIRMGPRLEESILRTILKTLTASSFILGKSQLPVFDKNGMKRDSEGL